VTFLEVVLAMALLGLASATIANVLGYVTAIQRRQDTILGCAEVSNRVILQYLLNPKKLPPRGIPIEFNNDQYRWEIKVASIEYELAPEIDLAIEESGVSRASSPMSIDNRLERVVVTAWLAEDSGGTRSRDAGAPQVSIVRVVDRLNLGRNPAIRRTIMQSGERGIQDLIELITGGGGLPTPPPATSGPSGSSTEPRR